MAAVESAWGRYPGYRVDLVPWRGRGRVRLGDRVLAESDACLIVEELAASDPPLENVVWTYRKPLEQVARVGRERLHQLHLEAIAVERDIAGEPGHTQWLLYANPAIYAGRGLAQGEGRVFTRDGRLVASYTVQAMIREFATPPGAMGKDHTDAM